MGRKLLYISFILVVVLSLGASVFAQEYWEVNRFTQQQEILKYKITSLGLSSEWDWETAEETITEIVKVQYLALEVSKVDEQTIEVITSYTNYYSPQNLQDKISLLGGLFTTMITNAEAFGELMMMGFFAEQLELEVGNNVLLFDGSRIKVGGKQKLAGV